MQATRLQKKMQKKQVQDGPDGVIGCQNMGIRLAAKENASIMDDKQSRMINLLLFASSCNSDTLKDIYSLADPDYKAYNSNGRVDRSGVGIGLNHQV
mgnify:CR=1 FL=1